MSGGSSAQTNANPSSSSIKQAPTAEWSYTATENMYTPIVVDGSVFFTAEDKHLYAVDAATGRERWRTYFAAGVGGTPAYSENALLVCDNTDTVYRLQPDTGATIWEFELEATSTVYGPGYSPPSPIIADRRVYVPTKSALYALDIETGDPRWVRRPGPTGGSLLTHPAVSAGRAVVGEWTSGPSTSDAENLGLYAYDAETGKLLWENSPRTTDESIDRIQDPPALTPEAVYVTSEGNEVHRVDAATGEIVWTHTLSEESFGSPSALTVTDSAAYLSVENGILALALDTGEPRWQSRNRMMWGFRPSVDSSQLYTSVGTELWALDRASGERRWTHPDVYGSIVVAGGTLYVADDKSVTALEVLRPGKPHGRKTGARANEALISLGIGAAIILGNLYAIWRSRRSERK
ncbi:outer membrane protein assembly factor BamB family protein [Halococcus thailandensis]|uniref:WD40-like repeat-containing protein n=1 Tax=Halococcus thailandensis JCM 13552 TaxID=1227457 RepID=M0NI38_9EURY|nr:PQQ-binding-like beta-propeller repeat protein [Halococcus thailandensis]EMA56335.1 WD40-like repeat-containing protein [Halococcus thailandensis JCM 13552]